MYNNNTFTIDQVGKEIFTFSENSEIITLCASYLPKFKNSLCFYVRAEKHAFYDGTFKILRLYTFRK